jgi:dimethylhistidine N-methyltransferase
MIRPRPSALQQCEDEGQPDSGLLETVCEGLERHPKRIAPKLFYDERGSRLFDAICRLPEYYLTRSEMAILEARAAEIAQLVGAGGTLIELGSGASRKIRLLLDALRPRHYVGVDISRQILIESVQRLAEDYPWLEVHAACADFLHDWALPGSMANGRKLVFFPGSTIGNLEPDEAQAFLVRTRKMLEPDGALLIGVDLKKDPRMLHAAYNDSQGVTAQFNLNLLERLRREFAAEFDRDGFYHCAFYNRRAGRIEMHLVSRRAQEMHLRGHRFVFAAGETIHTENSYKYSIEDFQLLARRAGFLALRAWTDVGRLFGVHLFQPIPASTYDPDVTA